MGLANYSQDPVTVEESTTPTTAPVVTEVKKVDAPATEEQPKTEEPVANDNGADLGKNYNYFAIDKVNNKIANGWEYYNLDNESIKTYSKNDLIDQFPDRKVSDFAIVTRGSLSKKGLDPSDTNNWL